MTDLATMHPEDIKAGLRKRYGTVTEFERVKGLPSKSVAEILRGRTWRKVADTIEAALQEPIPTQSENSDHNELSTQPHRLSSRTR